MQIKKDNYYLGQSSVVKVGGKGSDSNASIKLNINTNNISPTVGASLSGSIKDINGNGIKGAVVKLIDGNLKPLTFAYTDSSGNYLIGSIPYSSTYKILATATGKKISEVSSLNIVATQNINFNFTLLDDPNAILGAISGTISNNSFTSPTPISGAIVYLYITANNVQSLIQISYTDSLGEFIFNELDPGIYIIKVLALGYNEITISAIVQAGQVVSVSNTAPLSALATNSVISGVIVNDEGKKVSNADVILYSIDLQNNLSPIAYTTTNLMGVYTFVNVPIGRYIVKSTQSQLVEITPFLTSSVNPVINSQPMTAFSSISMNLEEFALNNLEQDYSKQGNTNSKNLIEENQNEEEIIKSTPKIPINSKLVFDENMNPSVKNISNDNLLFTKNNEILPKSTPKIPINSKLLLSKDMIPSISSDLKKKDNNEADKFLNIFMGQLENGAAFNFDGKCIKNIGGAKDGSLTINYNASKAATYNLIMEIENVNKSFFININGVEKKILPQEGLDNSDKISVITNIPLNFGENIIKFHGDGINYAPNLFSATLKVINSNKIPLISALPSGIYNVTSGILSNGAYLNNGYVSNIGGTNNGTAIVKVIVDEDNYYDLKIYYRNLDDFDKPLSVDINGVNTGEIYWLGKSDNESINIKVSLNAGINVVKFSGNSIDYAPDLGILTIVMNSYYVQELKF